MLSFFTRVILARGLGPSKFGRLSIGVAIVATTTTFVLLGMNSGIGRYLPRMQTVSEKRSVIVSGFQISLSVAILSTICVYLAAGWLATSVFDDASLRVVIKVFSLCIPLFTLLKLTVGGIRGLEKALPRVLVENLAFPGGRLIFTGVALLFGATVTNVSWGYFLAYALGAVTGLYYLYTRIPLLGRPRDSMHRTLLSFSAPLVITAAMATVIADIDTFIIGYFLTPRYVGIYNVVYPFAALASIFLSSLSFLFMPVVSELHAAGEFEQISIIYAIATKWLFLATTPIVLLFVMFGDNLLGITFGSEYLPGELTLSLLAIGFGTHTIFGPNRDTLTSIGRTRWIMISNIGIALFNVGMNIVLVPRFGIEGAAVATAASYTFLNCLYSYRLYSDMGINPFKRRFIRHLFTGTIVGLIFITTENWLAPTSTLGITLIYLLYLAVYAAALSYVGILDSKEIEFLSNIAKEPENRLGRLIQRLGIFE